MTALGELSWLPYPIGARTRYTRRGIAGCDLPTTSNRVGPTTLPLSSHHVKPVLKHTTYRAPPRWRPGSFHVNLCLLMLIIISIGGTLVTATGLEGRAILLQSTLERLARRGEILVDHRPPPLVRQLERRQFFSTTPQPTQGSSEESPTAQPSTTTRTTSSESTSPSLEPSTTSTMTTDPDAESPSPLPRPFDTSLGANFTSNNCPNFFQRFLGSGEFSECLPFSLLLQVCLVMTVRHWKRKHTKFEITAIRIPIRFSRPRKAVLESLKPSMPPVMSTSILVRASCHDWLRKSANHQSVDQITQIKTHWSCKHTMV